MNRKKWKKNSLLKNRKRKEKKKEKEIATGKKYYCKNY